MNLIEYVLVPYVFFLVLLYFGRHLIVYLINLQNWKIVLSTIVISNSLTIFASLFIAMKVRHDIVRYIPEWLFISISISIAANLGSYLMKTINDFSSGFSTYRGVCTVHFITYRHRIALYMLRFVEPNTTTPIDVEIPHAIYKRLYAAQKETLPVKITLVYLRNLHLALEVRSQWLSEGN